MPEESFYQDQMNPTPDDSTIFQSDLETLNVNVWFNGIEAKLQHCLVKEKVQDGVFQYKMLVRHLEILAISARRMVEKDYEEAVKKELEKKVNKYDEDIAADMKESMIRYGVIQKHLLKARKSSMSINYKPE